MLSPIQIRRHWIRRVVFEPHDVPVENSPYEAHFSLQHEKTDGCWRVILKVYFGGKKPDKTLHNGQIEFEGLFDVHPDFPEEKVENLVRLNGGAILYGAVRELVLNLTARSKYGPFEMPTINPQMFLELSEKAGATETMPKALKE